MDASKATGLDSIGPRLLKMAPNVLVPSIAFMMNKSIETGFFSKYMEKCKSESNIQNWRQG